MQNISLFIVDELHLIGGESGVREWGRREGGGGGGQGRVKETGKAIMEGGV